MCALISHFPFCRSFILVCVACAFDSLFARTSWWTHSQYFCRIASTLKRANCLLMLWCSKMKLIQFTPKRAVKTFRRRCCILIVHSTKCAHSAKRKTENIAFKLATKAHRDRLSRNRRQVKRWKFGFFSVCFWEFYFSRARLSRRISILLKISHTFVHSIFTSRYSTLHSIYHWIACCSTATNDDA